MALERVRLLDSQRPVGVEIAKNLSEIFKEVPPGHPLFRRFSLITPEMVPDYEARLTRLTNTGRLSEKVSEAFLALALAYVEPRMRFGLLKDPSLKTRLVGARSIVQDAWTARTVATSKPTMPAVSTLGRACSTTPVRPASTLADAQRRHHPARGFWPSAGSWISKPASAAAVSSGRSATAACCCRNGSGCVSPHARPPAPTGNPRHRPGGRPSRWRGRHPAPVVERSRRPRASSPRSRPRPTLRCFPGTLRLDQGRAGAAECRRMTGRRLLAESPRLHHGGRDGFGPDGSGPDRREGSVRAYGAAAPRAARARPVACRPISARSATTACSASEGRLEQPVTTAAG